MSTELIGILGVGVSLAIFIWRTSAQSERRLDNRMGRVEDRMGRVEWSIGRLRERMAALEGLIAGAIPNGRLVLRTNVKKKQEEE